jgi:hypothetical protein
VQTRVACQRTFDAEDGAVTRPRPTPASYRLNPAHCVRCEPGLAPRKPLPQQRTSSHASSTMSYTAKNHTQRQFSITPMNKNSNEPK